MGVRIDNVESDMRNANISIADTRNEIRTVRTLWNAVTIATLIVVITLFIWLDGKSDAKFNNVMNEIRTSNAQVNTDLKDLSIEIVKINQSILAIKKDHDKKYRP
jgi:hypothetical protein